MFAVQLRAEMSGDDTDVDVPVLSRQPSRPARIASSSNELKKVPAAREATGPMVGAASWDSSKSRSLLDVQLRESAGRRGASAVSRRLASQPGRPVLVRIDFVRSLDRDVRVVTVGADTIVIDGVAAGRTVEGRRPASIAVAVEGRMYSVVLEGGESSIESANRIARRLSSDFVVETDGSHVRIVRER
ncbi:MAG: hypothetical protein HYV07_24325 [Deltaproteobacteria bacterium]|nr:hypothetical protein [Deltaproteobacteria bacterium]